MCLAIRCHLVVLSTSYTLMLTTVHVVRLVVHVFSCAGRFTPGQHGNLPTICPGTICNNFNLFQRETISIYIVQVFSPFD